MSWELKNPLPESFKDSGKVYEFFNVFYTNKKLIVPYYNASGYTAHSFLLKISQLCERSPSFASAETQILNNAFSKSPNAVFKPIPGIPDAELPEMTYEQKVDYLTWLKAIGLNVRKLKKQTRLLSKHFRRTGNFWLKVTLANEGGVWAMKTEAVHAFHMAYLKTKTGAPKKAVHSLYWGLEGETDGTKVKMEVFPVSTPETGLNWKEKNKGEILQTVIHVKTEGSDEGTWYGRSICNSIIDAMGSEVARQDSKVKKNNTTLVATNVMAFEGEPAQSRVLKNPKSEGSETKEDDFTKTVKVLRKVVSTEGDHSEVRSLAAIEYPNGTKPPTNIKLDVSRDDKWGTSNKEEDRENIFGVMGASMEIRGTQQAKSGIGTETLISRYIVLNEETIEPEQLFFEDFWNWFIEEIAIKTGETEFVKYGIKFPDKIAALVTKLQDSMKAKKEATGQVKTSDNGDNDDD